MTGVQTCALPIYLPKHPRFRSIPPLLLEHLRLALGELDLELPLALSLDVEMRRIMVVRPEPARQPWNLEARDLGLGSPATAPSILRNRTFFNDDKITNVRSRR